MSLIVTNFTIEPRIYGWTTLPDPAESVVPRAEIVYSLTGEAVEASAAGNNQEVRISCSLPRNYAYVLVDLYYAISMQVVGEANTWEASSQTLLRTNEIPSRFWIESESKNVTKGTYTTSDLTEMRSYSPCNSLPKQLLKSGKTPSLLFTLLSTGSVLEEGAAFLYYFARFLMYDVDQANRWEANTPTLVR